MDMVTPVQALNMAVYISHKPDTLGKGMNPIIFSLSVSK